MTRLDLTQLDTYIIDPPNCQDADDAFCITEDYLWVFIADPTDGFKPDDQIFDSIIRRVLTNYCTIPPLDLFPQEFVKQYSLKGGVKKAIGVKIDIKDVPQLSSINLVNIEAKHILDYDSAPLDTVLQRGIELSEKFFNQRKTIGKIQTVSIPKKRNDTWYFYTPSEQSLKLQTMISEFAILTNKLIALYLNEKGCSFNRSFDTQIEPGKGDLLIQIIKTGSSAHYTINNEKHLLIDDSIYTHFTSPLRRAQDCIVHFIVKAVMNGQKIPFTRERLKQLSLHFNKFVKQDKKKQHIYYKMGCIQAMQQILVDYGKLYIHLSFTGQFGQLFNFIITSIDIGQLKINVKVSVSVKLKSLLRNPIPEKVLITKIHPEQQFDSQIFPELLQGLI